MTTAAAIRASKAAADALLVLAASPPASGTAAAASKKRPSPETRAETRDAPSKTAKIVDAQPQPTAQPTAQPQPLAPAPAQPTSAAPVLPTRRVRFVVPHPNDVSDEQLKKVGFATINFIYTMMQMISVVSPAISPAPANASPAPANASPAAGPSNAPANADAAGPSNTNNQTSAAPDVSPRDASIPAPSPTPQSPSQSPATAAAILQRRSQPGIGRRPAIDDVVKWCILTKRALVQMSPKALLTIDEVIVLLATFEREHYHKMPAGKYVAVGTFRKAVKELCGGLTWKDIGSAKDSDRNKQIDDATAITAAKTKMRAV